VAHARAVVTGGAGFVGGALVRQLLEVGFERVVSVDALTYAANPLATGGRWPDDDRHALVVGDVCDSERLFETLCDEQPTVVFHLAAESHVDRSIDAPRRFVETNVLGTEGVLTACLRYWRDARTELSDRFRLVHCSTDEVYGSAQPSEWFTEQTPYRPSSPYSASKAAADHLARAWHHTYGLPVVVSNCGNNYGPFQFPEKLMPHMLVRALRGDTLPVYGNGGQQRDWIHVTDHAAALRRLAEAGTPGSTYLVGARTVRSNLEVVTALCDALDRLAPRPDGAPHASAIRFVTDRPGHDTRYALDPTRLERELGWRAQVEFTAGLADTVAWYLEHRAWWQSILDGSYRAERLGLGAVA
jgi:dTDP-glucose 4,6-dehydratase